MKKNKKKITKKKKRIEYDHQFNTQTQHASNQANKRKKRKKKNEKTKKKRPFD